MPAKNTYSYDWLGVSFDARESATWIRPFMPILVLPIAVIFVAVLHIQHSFKRIIS